MKYDVLKRCHECGRLYDGFECPECGLYAQEYARPEIYGDGDNDLDDLEFDLDYDNTDVTDEIEI